MTNNFRCKIKKVSHGQSLIELAVLLPLLLMLVLGVIDYARAIQFNNILVAMSREGANLASRTSALPQDIIRALNNTAEPLVMSTRGRVYITQIVGRKVVPTCVDAPPAFCATFPKVVSQTRAVIGEATLTSKVWSCSAGWNGNGTCNSVPASATAIIPMTLSDGEEVYAVEALYDYNVIISYVMQTAPRLYSMTVL
jgi:Flp pilus assembly protein TadG